LETTVQSYVTANIGVAEVMQRLRPAAKTPLDLVDSIEEICALLAARLDVIFS
jgi:hypothetical protein